MKHLRLFLAAALLVPTLTLAHGDSPSFEKQEGDYLIDIGYDRIGIQPGEPVTFDFDLFTQSGTLAFAPFSQVSIRIMKGEGDVIETATNDGTNVPTLAVTFPEEGTYSLYVTYYNQDGAEIVSTTFDVPVAAHSGTVGRAANIATMIAAVFLMGLGIVVIVQQLMKKRSV